MDRPLAHVAFRICRDLIRISILLNHQHQHNKELFHIEDRSLDGKSSRQLRIEFAIWSRILQLLLIEPNEASSGYRHESYLDEYEF